MTRWNKVLVRLVLLLSIVGVVSGGSFAVAGLGDAQAGASCAANLTASFDYVSNGLNFFLVYFPTTYVLGSLVYFNPASGYYQDDTWSNGFNNSSGTTYWYFSYDKRSNPGGAYFQVTHC
jgi:hypothetical protein